MKIYTITFAAAVLLAIASCRKEIFPSGTQNRNIDSSKVFLTPSTPAGMRLVENLVKLSTVLKELYKDKQNLKVVNAAIFSRAYTDESILLKDLIYPGRSRLNDIEQFKVYTKNWNIDLRQFSVNFWKEVHKRNDEDFKLFLEEFAPESFNTISNDNLPAAGAMRLNTDEEQVSIYFPFSEMFAVDDAETIYDPITSIVAATADADEGWGDQPLYKDGVLQSYTKVLVDDEYAYNHPTQIVGVNGVEPVQPSSPNYPAILPGDAIDLPDLEREVKQVYIGELKIRNHQYDKLISFTGNGGGSEIRFTRADGYLKVADGQVQTADVFFTPALEISRYNIKNGNWVDLSLEWDGDWELMNLQQNLAIYEEDNRNSSIFTGSLSTNLSATIPPVSATIERSIGFTINFKSDDELIRQLNFNRDVFFVLNRANLEGEIRNGFAVRDRNADVSFTLKDRTFY